MVGIINTQFLRFSCQGFHTKDILSTSEDSLNTGTNTVTVAMFSEEFQGWGESAFRGIGRAQLDDAGTTGLTLPQPSNVGLGKHCDYQSGELMVREQEHPLASAENVVSGFAVSPMSDAAHSSGSHIVYPQLPTPRITPNNSGHSSNPSNPLDHPTSTVVVHPKRHEKAKSKRKRHISETDDDDDVDENIIGPSIDSDVPRSNSNRVCVHSLLYRIYLGH